MTVSLPCTDVDPLGVEFECDRIVAVFNQRHAREGIHGPPQVRSRTTFHSVNRSPEPRCAHGWEEYTWKTCNSSSDNLSGTGYLWGCGVFANGRFMIPAIVPPERCILIWVCFSHLSSGTFYSINSPNSSSFQVRQLACTAPSVRGPVMCPLPRPSPQLH